MNGIKCLFCMFALAGLVGCTPGGPIRVRSFWGTTIERMPHSSTYAWWSGGAETRATDASLDELIRHRIDVELQEFGFRRVDDPAQATFLVSYIAGHGFHPTSRGPTDLAILAVEAHNPDGRLIWRGWADGSVDPGATPEVRRARLTEAVRVIIKQFHPECCH